MSTVTVGSMVTVVIVDVVSILVTLGATELISSIVVYSVMVSHYSHCCVDSGRPHCGGQPSWSASWSLLVSTILVSHGGHCGGHLCCNP